MGNKRKCVLKILLTVKKYVIMVDLRKLLYNNFTIGICDNPEV